MPDRHCVHGCDHGHCIPCLRQRVAELERLNDALAEQHVLLAKRVTPPADEAPRRIVGPAVFGCVPEGWGM